ncbi:carboxypeptidase-like regulatory domain-containing protein [Maribacter sp. ACAM166]|uniref:carboxypeptidase-like regulatory domain-containing protein n=1 Tax=Maribacter sp. ACAM166 TaxID=2508996 RepID=UPI0020180CE2|nr:carboxypeptidase-like regulatory domain-containing protein [Maribacter sp. ACAM166]
MSIKKIYLLLLLSLIANTSPLIAQSLSAVVLDSLSKEPIPYATILLNNKGVITNEDGNFSFILDEEIKESDSLFISCIGYKSVAKQLLEFKTNEILLRPKAIELKEVIVSNKNYTADEIIDLVEENLEKNYTNAYSKKRLFYRNSSFNRMTKTNFTIKESTIDAFNQQFLDSVINTVPKSNSYYTEILGDLYGNFEEDKQKLNLIKASELYDKSMEIDLEKLEEKFNDIIKKNVRTDSYFKVKSGLFGTKLDANEIFESDIDSTDIAALNKEIEKKKKNQELRKINFANYRKKSLSALFKQLPIHEDTDYNFITKSRKYEYTLKEFTYLGNDAVYVIDFISKGSADYKGTLYINSDDFALIRADYENIKSVKSFNLLGISTNTYLSKGKAIFFKETFGQYGLRYFESETGTRIGVKRPLKIIEKNKVVKGKNRQNELSGKMDFVFTDVQKNEIVVFDTESISENQFESYKEGNSILPTYMPKYDPEFWKGYTIMEPNTAIKEFTSTELE